MVVIENVHAYCLVRRPVYLLALAAGAPFDGEMMIGLGTVIDHGNDELIAILIVTDGLKVGRHHRGVGGCHRDRNCNQQAAAQVV